MTRKMTRTGKTVPRIKMRAQTRRQVKYFTRQEKERERLWREYRDCVQKRHKETGEPLTLCELACKRETIYKKKSS